MSPLGTFLTQSHATGGRRQRARSGTAPASAGPTPATAMRMPGRCLPARARRGAGRAETPSPHRVPIGLLTLTCRSAETDLAARPAPALSWHPVIWPPPGIDPAAASAGTLTGHQEVTSMAGSENRATARPGASRRREARGRHRSPSHRQPARGRAGRYRDQAGRDRRPGKDDRADHAHRGRGAGLPRPGHPVAQAAGPQRSGRPRSRLGRSMPPSTSMTFPVM